MPYKISNQSVYAESMYSYIYIAVYMHTLRSVHGSHTMAYGMSCDSHAPYTPSHICHAMVEERAWEFPGVDVVMVPPFDCVNLFSSIVSERGGKGL